MGERNREVSAGKPEGQGADNVELLRQELHQRPQTDQAEGKLAVHAEGDLARIPLGVRTDMDRSEDFVQRELARFTKLMPREMDPRLVAHPETQEQVDARFARIKWNEYDQDKTTMGCRTDAQKQHLSEFDRSMLDLMEQQTLLHNYAGVTLLGDGLVRNAGKYRDLLQVFNKDLQTIGHQCQFKDGRFTIE